MDTLPVSVSPAFYDMAVNKTEGPMRPKLMATMIVAAMLPALSHAGEPRVMSDEDAVLHTISTMTDAFARGDIEQVMATYASPASVVAAPGQVVTGEQFS